MKKIIIDKENFKQRIDRFLVKELFSYTRGEIIHNIKAGNILVNGKKVKPSYALRRKDEVVIDIKIKSEKLESNPEVKFTVVYKDKNIVAINKTAGLQVHPIRSERDTLVNGLIEKFPEIKNVGDNPGLRPGIVHRLDKDTSGIMVVARNQDAFEELKKLFQGREVKKEYLAVVFGKPKEKKGIVEKPMARSRNYKKQTIANVKTRTKIRSAVTEYEVLKEYNKYSLIKVSPRTGRMHQIRVHLSALGHPIVGDKKYAHKNLEPPKEVRRQMLHARRIEISINGKKFSFSAKIPNDMSDFLAFLTGRR